LINSHIVYSNIWSPYLVKVRMSVAILSHISGNDLYDTISFDMSCLHCSVWRSDRCIVFSKLVKWKVLILKLYFERYSFTFHFTKFLSHFLKKLMLNRNYFLILSLMKKSFRYCVYILSRNREKQLCNKAIKTHKKPFWKRVRTRNTATPNREQVENSFISEF
jgi:hypothetical protein